MWSFILGVVFGLYGGAVLFWMSEDKREKKEDDVSTPDL